jgi:hypothetical protein
MFWIIHWTDAEAMADRSIVVEAGSRAEAEYMGLKRGIPVVSVCEASRNQVAAAARAKLLWRHTPQSRYTCWGKPLHPAHLAVLLAAGAATALLHLVPTIAAIAR